MYDSLYYTNELNIYESTFYSLGSKWSLTLSGKLTEFSFWLFNKLIDWLCAFSIPVWSFLSASLSNNCLLYFCSFAFALRFKSKISTRNLWIFWSFSEVAMMDFMEEFIDLMHFSPCLSYILIRDKSISSCSLSPAYIFLISWIYIKAVYNKSKF